MLPISELRGAIPVGIGLYELPVLTTVFMALVGNIVPVLFILYAFEWFYTISSRNSTLFQHFFEWLFKRTRHRFEGKYKKYGDLALILFVAIPLPITGAWTGSLAAFLFGIPPRRALPLIALGVVIAGVVVTLITTGVLESLEFLV